MVNDRVSARGRGLIEMRMEAARACALTVGVAVAAIAQSGCASFSYVDRGGARHVVGFVNVALPADEPQSTTVLGLTTFGLAIRTGGDAGAQATLGFSHETLVAAPPGACVDIVVPGVCADWQASKPKPATGKGPDT